MRGAASARGVSSTRAVVDELLRSNEPSVRWKVRRWVLGEDPEGRVMRRLEGEIRRSPRVRALLSAPLATRGVYSKWQGAHWILATLADLGYPPGDPALVPVRDEVLRTWLSRDYYREFEARTKAGAYRRKGVPVMNGRFRRCASQQGNALLSLTNLGLADERARDLAERLLHWQWPDGGWNCDREPGAAMSSVNETLLPMLGLAAHARASGDTTAGHAARHAAEVFLERRLFKRRRAGEVIHRDFTRLHYPLYWHYDIVGGLRGMVDVGMVGDGRCGDALDLLESKELREGGWPAEARFYRASPEVGLHNDYVDWGGTSTKRPNEWVTVDALGVLRAAGRVAL